MKKLIRISSLFLALVLTAMLIPAPTASAATTKTQFRYHCYVNEHGKRFICPAAGQRAYPGTTFKVVFTEYMDTPLAIDNGTYSNYVHTKTRACEQSGCIDCSYTGNRYRDSEGLTWFAEETRVVTKTSDAQDIWSRLLEAIRSRYAKQSQNDDIQLSVGLIAQQDEYGCYCASAAMVTSYFREQSGIPAVSYQEMKTANGNTTWWSWGTFRQFGATDVDIIRSKEKLSSEEKLTRIADALKEGTPVMMCFRKNGTDHMVVATGIRDGILLINDPARGSGGRNLLLTEAPYLTKKTGSTDQLAMLNYLAFATVIKPVG